MRSSEARGGAAPLGWKSTTVNAALLCTKQRKKLGGSPSAVPSRPWLIALCATTSTIPSDGSCAYRSATRSSSPCQQQPSQSQGIMVGPTARICLQHNAPRYHSSLPPAQPTNESNSSPRLARTVIPWR